MNALYKDRRIECTADAVLIHGPGWGVPRVTAVDRGLAVDRVHGRPPDRPHSPDQPHKAPDIAGQKRRNGSLFKHDDYLTGARAGIAHSAASAMTSRSLGQAARSPGWRPGWSETRSAGTHASPAVSHAA